MSAGPRSLRARSLRRRRVHAANIARNRLRRPERAAAWAGARRAAWEFLDRHVTPDARVAVVGAGNTDDVPLEQLAARAGALSLIDLDPRAPRRAVRRLPAELRARIDVHRCEVTSGAADGVIAAALRASDADGPGTNLPGGSASGTSASGASAPGASGPGASGPGAIGSAPRGPSERPLPGAPYDVVIGDLLYSQLVYPALLDAQLADSRLLSTLEHHAQPLTDVVVARMHASTRRGGVVVHLHDTAGWWEGHPQPVPIASVLAAATSEEALELAGACRKPVGTDPRRSAHRLGARVLDTAFWEWPFDAGVSYLVCATATEPPPPAASGADVGVRLT